jgi:hypothetical protein
MIFHGFVHADGGNMNDSLFRSTVLQFVNDTDTHPIVKYQAFIVAFILIVSGLLILLLLNGERIFGHSYWNHLFIPISPEDDETMTDAAIFRKAIEGMSSSSSSSSSDSSDRSNESQENQTGADSQAAQKSKKSACGTDCGKYIDLKRKINDLAKYVDAVNEQRENIKQTDEKIKELGKKIEDLNKSLSPGGQLKVQI